MPTKHNDPAPWFRNSLSGDVEAMRLVASMHDSEMEHFPPQHSEGTAESGPLGPPPSSVEQALQHTASDMRRERVRAAVESLPAKSQAASVYIALGHATNTSALFVAREHYRVIVGGEWAQLPRVQQNEVMLAMRADEARRREQVAAA
jgi:hypothetical protein